MRECVECQTNEEYENLKEYQGEVFCPSCLDNRREDEKQ